MYMTHELYIYDAIRSDVIHSLQRHVYESKTENAYEPRNIHMSHELCVKDSTEDTAPPKSSTSRNSHSSVHIQFETKCQFEFVPRDAKKSKFLDLVNFRDATFLMETELSYMSRDYMRFTSCGLLSSNLLIVPELNRCKFLE